MPLLVVLVVIGRPSRGPALLLAFWRTMHDDVEPLVAGGGAALVGAGRGSPGASLTEVARRVDVAKSTAHHHVAPLVADGRVEGRRVGRTLRLYPGEAADGREESLRGMNGKGK